MIVFNQNRCANTRNREWMQSHTSSQELIILLTISTGVFMHQYWHPDAHNLCTHTDELPNHQTSHRPFIVGPTKKSKYVFIIWEHSYFRMSFCKSIHFSYPVGPNQNLWVWENQLTLNFDGFNKLIVQFYTFKWTYPRKNINPITTRWVGLHTYMYVFTGDIENVYSAYK